jgi:tetratricopeptide (TPR) repeat protein
LTFGAGLLLIVSAGAGLYFSRRVKVASPPPALLSSAKTSAVEEPKPFPKKSAVVRRQIPKKRKAKLVEKETKPSPQTAPLNADEEYERVLATAPDDERIRDAKKWHQEGEAAFRAGRFSEARDFFQQSRALAPAYVPAWLYEIRCLQKLDRKPEAQALARALLTRQPELGSLPLLKPYRNEPK